MKKVIDFYWYKDAGIGYFFLEDSDVHVSASGVFLQSCRCGRWGEHTEARKLADGRIVDVLGFRHPERKKMSYAEHVITMIQTMLDKGYGLSFKAQKQFEYWKNRFTGEELEKERRRQAEELAKQNREIKTDRESEKWQTYIR